MGFKFDCSYTPSRSTGGDSASRSYQNSFVRVLARDIISVVPTANGNLVRHAGDVGLTETGATRSRTDLVVQIECFVHAYSRDHEDGCGEAFALVQVLKNARDSTFAGAKTIHTDVPQDCPAFESLYLVSVEDFKSQLLMLKGSSTAPGLRFMKCPGKLHHVN